MNLTKKQKKYNKTRLKAKLDLYKKIQDYCKKETDKNIRPGVIIQEACKKYKVAYVTVYRAIKYKF